MSKPEFNFETLEEMVVAAAEAVRPPERLTVSQAAAKYRKLNNPGAYVGPWKNETAPYLVEIMDTLTSLDFTAVVFVAPARTGKSDIWFNWLTYGVVCDPADMLAVQMTMNVARDWSNRDFRRAIRATTALNTRMMPGKQNDNTFDKNFINGMGVLVKWPTITELSGKTVPRVALNDYDRMPQNVDGQGSPFDLGRKRTTTFKRFGMTYVEGSPGFPIEDPKWTRKTPHEAPPCKGILALYNRGDRRRLYWQCPECIEAFEPTFDLLKWDTSLTDKIDISKSVFMACPHCGGCIEPTQKKELNLGARWLIEGQKWLPTGEIVGTPLKSDIASFWCFGPVAAFQNWESLVLNHLAATEEYESTGAETALITTTNLDQGDAYLPKALASGRLPDDLKNRAQDWGGSAEDPVVPYGTRFLVTTVDVQKKSFVVQVHGIGIGGDTWIVDMFKIWKSKRLDKDGDPLPISPDSYPEDWQVLVDEVLERTYPLGDGSGRRMRLKAGGCDLSGEAGVTVNGVAFWRWLRDVHPGDHHKRFQLVKGEPSVSAPLVSRRFPEATRKDRHSSLRGDVPVLFINSTKAKDKVSGMLGRVDPATGELTLAGGQVNFPIWAEDWLYKQLTAETRGPVRWENKQQKRNEAWDLLTYSYAICMNGAQISPTIDNIDWANPPIWAREWDENDLVFDPSKISEEELFQVEDETFDLAKLARSVS